MTATHGGELTRAFLAEAVLAVPGVAFLRPGLGERLRAGAASRAGRSPRPTSGDGSSGIRIGGPPGSGPTAIEVHVVLLRGHRTLDVTRAVREAVLAVCPAGAGTIPVRVTVTGIV
ncbi:Asp23/Gls24 family envelope stress response protein [Streptomyces sp. NPDC101733]|uniref:Asp23/Gls24 family envelope stress response protein n=1 Tax=unclassified Streptomyces TaxID=2593676 RepID=UPI0037FCFE5E